MNHHRAARAAATAVLVLAPSTLIAGCGSSSDSSSPQADTSASAPTYDHSAADAGAGWLTAQRSDGVVHNEQYDTDDLGLTSDVALALAAVGGHDETVQTISDQLARHVDDYTSPGFGTLVSAGGTAKALVVADAAGADPTSYGGTDLVAQLEHTVVAGGPSAGRIHDELDPKEKSAADYANVVGQALAVLGTTAADSPKAGAVTDFLLEQQCSPGWFRLSFAPDQKSRDQSCDGDSASAADVDATAYAVLALDASGEDGAAEHVDSAVSWLVSVQRPDGSFANAGPGGGPNTNSTGLAGRALAAAGRTDAAEKAAGWVAAHQVAQACGKYDDADRGAIAYDDAGLAEGERRGITAKASDQFRRSTAGALPVLQWLPADAVPTATGGADGCQ